MGEQVAFAGVVEQARLVKSGDVTPSELVELYLERIERLDPELNSYRVVLAEKARAEAKEVERRLAAHEDLPMAGVPIAIKDVEDVEGELTCKGTTAFDRPAEADSEHVRRLRAAGAIVLGKTNVPELAIFGFTETEAYGATRNPWDPSRSAGGSSGGTGAAVAAGLCAAGSASDGAGSIRIPAAFTGTFGLKPQRGRIPLDPGAEDWHGLTVVGAITRTVADTALWLDVTAARGRGVPPHGDHTFLDAVQGRPHRLRIAYSTKPVRIVAPPKLADEVAGAVEHAAALLRSLGHQVESADPAWGLIGNHLTPRYLSGIADDAARAPHPERFEERTKGFVRMGRLTKPFVNSARRSEARDARRVFQIFDRCDVLVMPVTGEPAIEVGRWAGKGAVRTLLGMSRTYPYCVPWNHLGNPAASVPLGFDSRGLPLAVQLIGRRNDEATLLSLAAQIEAAQPWADRRPPNA